MKRTPAQLLDAERARAAVQAARAAKLRGAGRDRADQALERTRGRIMLLEDRAAAAADRAAAAAARAAAPELRAAERRARLELAESARTRKLDQLWKKQERKALAAQSKVEAQRDAIARRLEAGKLPTVAQADALARRERERARTERELIKVAEGRLSKQDPVRRELERARAAVARAARPPADPLQKALRSRKPGLAAVARRMRETEKGDLKKGLSKEQARQKAIASLEKWQNSVKPKQPKPPKLKKPKAPPKAGASGGGGGGKKPKSPPIIGRGNRVTGASPGSPYVDPSMAPEVAAVAAARALARHPGEIVEAYLEGPDGQKIELDVDQLSEGPQEAQAHILEVARAQGWQTCRPLIELE